MATAIELWKEYVAKCASVTEMEAIFARSADNAVLASNVALASSCMRSLAAVMRERDAALSAFLASREQPRPAKTEDHG